MDLIAFQQSDFDGMAMTRERKAVAVAARNGVGHSLVKQSEVSAWEYVHRRGVLGVRRCRSSIQAQLTNGICALCAAEQAGIPATPDEPDDPASGVPAAAELDDEAAAEAADQSELLW